jgi:hypothetical protein
MFLLYLHETIFTINIRRVLLQIRSVSVGFGRFRVRPWSVPILIASEEASFPIRHFHRFGFYVPLASLGKPIPFWILELGLNEIM